jgi:hypothetical protein
MKVLFPIDDERNGFRNLNPITYSYKYFLLKDFKKSNITWEDEIDEDEFKYYSKDNIIKCLIIG